jgi:hypothetical protein
MGSAFREIAFLVDLPPVQTIPLSGLSDLVANQREAIRSAVLV